MISSHFSMPTSVSGFDRVDGTFRFATAAIDAFVGVNDKHVLALIEAVHRTYLDTVHVFAANAALIDDVGQLSLLSEGWPSTSESTE